MSDGCIQRCITAIDRHAPLCFKLLSVVANTTPYFASHELVIHALLPFSTKWSSFSTATVDAAPASLPFPGSDSMKQPRTSPDALQSRTK